MKNKLFDDNIQLIPVSDLNITLDPEITTGYDFTVEDYYTFASADGIFVQDTMAVWHPLSDEAQAEITEKMMTLKGPESSNSIIFELSKEMYAGLYLLTKSDVMIKNNSPIQVSYEDLEKATDPYIYVKFRNKTTTMGKAIFNSCFPEDFEFIDEIITKKSIKKIINKLMTSGYNDDEIINTVSKMEKLGFKFATILAPTFSLDMVEVPKEIYKLKEKMDKSTPEEADNILKEMKKIMIEHLKNTGIYDLVESGAGRGWDQPLQILCAKGVIADAKGKILDPIKGSFSDGLNSKEYFESTSGARKGLADRVINTADTGYLSRKLAYVLNSVEADLYLKDCRTKNTMTLKLNKDIMSKIKGRYILRNNKIEEFDPSIHKEGMTVHLRTPIYCESKKICHTCYGRLLERHKTPYVGILAAGIIGENSTQAIMKSFHTGGAVKVKKRNILEDLVQNNPMMEFEDFKFASYRIIKK